MDQELITYLDQRFGEVNQQIQELREESRHTRILVEDLRDDVRLLAEVVDNNDEKTERRFEALETALAQESAETRSLIKMSYADLDRRVTALEAKAS